MPLESEPLIPCKRKVLSPPPSGEYVFRPCLKQVPRQSSYVDKPYGIKMVPSPNQAIEDRPVGKKAYFPYKAEREENDKKLFRDMSEANLVKNELRLLQRIGFVKKEYDSLSNRNLMRLNFIRDQFGSLKLDDEFNYVHGMNNNEMNKQSSYNMKGYESLTRKQKKEIQKQIEEYKRSELANDIKYVNKLNK